VAARFRQVAATLPDSRRGRAGPDVWQSLGVQAALFFRGMTDFVYEPPLRLTRDVTVRTLDDDAEFARTYVGSRLPHRRHRLVRRLEEVSDEASARVAARGFRAWAIAEGLLAEES
jgi:hypothetical protein